MNTTLENIYLSSLKLLEPSDPESTYKTILEESLRLTGAVYGSVFLANNGVLQRVYSNFQRPRNFKVRPRGLTYSAYIGGKLKIIHRGIIDKVHPEMPSDLKTFIFIPLYYGGKPTGVINLMSTKQDLKFPPHKRYGLELFGSMASLSIKKTQSQYEAQQAVKKLELFMSMASHELKSPLTVLRLYAQLIYDKSRNDATGTEPLFAEKILNETDRLSGLVQELLQINVKKDTDLQFTEESCHVRTILQNAITNCQINYPDRIFTYTDKLHSRNDIVVGDSAKLTQAFINILNNAAKFSPPNSTIDISSKRCGSRICLLIRDQGPGIGKADLPKIFNEYYKGKHRKPVGGMGLGLSIVKKIVDHSNGSIQVRSKLNKGTTVQVTFPSV